MAARITRGAGASVLYRMLQTPSNKPWAGDSLNCGPPAATANQRSAAAPLAVRAMKMPTARLNLFRTGHMLTAQLVSLLSLWHHSRAWFRDAKK